MMVRACEDILSPEKIRFRRPCMARLSTNKVRVTLWPSTFRVSSAAILSLWVAGLAGSSEVSCWVIGWP